MNKFVWGAIIFVFMVPLLMGPVRGWIHMLRTSDNINSTEPPKRVITESKDKLSTKNKRSSLQTTVNAVKPVPEEKDSIHGGVLNYRLQSKERIEKIQNALKNAGFYAGDIDGKIGARTRRAIKEFQKSRGLKPDGVVGSKTWEALNKFFKK